MFHKEGTIIHNLDVLDYAWLSVIYLIKNTDNYNSNVLESCRLFYGIYMEIT